MAEHEWLIVAPSDNGLPEQADHLQHQVFVAGRKELLRSLRLMPAIFEYVRHLNPEQLYRIPLIPEGAHLAVDSSGLSEGVFRNAQGTIVQHARLQTVSPSILRGAAALGMQVMLLRLAAQLDRIEAIACRIEKSLRNDRFAAVEAGILQYHLAQHCQDRDRRHRLLENAVQTLTEAVLKTHHQLEEEVGAAPEPSNTFLDNWGIRPKSSYAQDRMEAARETFSYHLRGIRFLSQTYAALGEPLVATQTLSDLMPKTKALVDTAAKKARLVPRSSDNCDPESSWVEFQRGYAALQAELSPIEASAKGRPTTAVALEIYPRELLEEL